ncbi:MAG: DUF5686 family protein [Candidatus Azobacteroides sp.]|nr:DUF5686 family protein [Candidatus Azobacteroides sp.]
MNSVRFHIILMIFSLFGLPVHISGSGHDIPEANDIIREVIKRAESYSSYVDEYEANVYVRGTSHVLKRNILSFYAPDIFFIDKKNDQNILEAIVNVRYKAPNTFFQEIKAISGTIKNIQDVQSRAMRFLNMNIYNPTSFNDEVLMPISSKTSGYYRFSYLSSKDTLGMKIYTIKIDPKINSQRLISGTISVVSGSWIISNIDIKGKWEFTDYRVCTDFKIFDDEFSLPGQTNLFFKMKLLGNEVEDHYVSKIEYTAINKYKDESNHSYDLTNYFNVRLDSLPVLKDSAFWNENRPIPLTASEEEIYRNNRKQIKLLEDTLSFKEKSWNLTKEIISSKEFDFAGADFHYSGLINPLKLAYTKLDGFVYWQQLKLYHAFESGQTLSFDPGIGFVFKRDEIFYKFPFSWLYQPRNMGQFSLSFENGNNSYSSKVIDEINNELKNSVFKFDDLNLEYYKHYYLSLRNSNELFNGFLLSLGINYDLYTPVRSGNNPESNPEILNGLVDEDYKSFTPVIGLIYTPKQYYRFAGNRKNYAGSVFPTFSVEYARGIPGVLGSISDHERIEADVLQRISLGLLYSFRYYVGGGVFTNTKTTYFADFVKFSKRNFPQSWNEQMGGVFYLLDSKWYNASNAYAQAHLMYESPFILSRFMKGISREILLERIYLGQLYLPALPCYTEIGYSVGNYVISAGIFVGFEKGRYNGLGFKLEFEIGR